MNPIYCFVVALLSTGVSGYRIRGGGGRILSSPNDEMESMRDESMSFLYEVPSTTAAPTTTATTTPNHVPQSPPLAGNKWTAVEIGTILPRDDDGDDHPHITIAFDSDSLLLYGNAGCNRYRGNFRIPEESEEGGEEDGNGSSFRSPDEFSVTKMYCGREAMEREGDYLDFMRSGLFFYETRTVCDEVDIGGDVWKDELVLFGEATTGQQGAGSLGGRGGEILARFVRNSEQIRL